MKKIIVTESQLKRILDHNINEQRSKMIPSGGNSEGVVKIINGKYMVVVRSESNQVETIGPFTFKVPVKNGQPVFVSNVKGMIVVYGTNPKNPKGENIRYN